MLVRQLPPGARTRIAGGDRDGLWGLAEHLHALTLDELRMANWQRANEGAKSPTKPPQPIPRPGDGRRPARADDPERLAKRDAARERAAARREQILTGQIT